MIWNITYILPKQDAPITYLSKRKLITSKLFRNNLCPALITNMKTSLLLGTIVMCS